MNKQEFMEILKCDCGCSMLVVEKTIWEDGDIDFNISIQDSRYDHNNKTIWGRIKGAMKILFGKPVYYSDVYIGKPEIYNNFVEKMKKLCEETNSPSRQS